MSWVLGPDTPDRGCAGMSSATAHGLGSLHRSFVASDGGMMAHLTGSAGPRWVVALALAAGFTTDARAFHSGGVGECEGCHSMHNSYEGAANVTGMAQYQSGPYLLKAQDQSGACLNCHEPSTADAAPSSYHISTVGVNAYDSTTPVEYTPGGDFAWL